MRSLAGVVEIIIISQSDCYYISLNLSQCEGGVRYDILSFQELDILRERLPLVRQIPADQYRGLTFAVVRFFPGIRIGVRRWMGIIDEKRIE